MNKTLDKAVFGILAIAPAAAGAAAYFFMPETVPVHFGIDGVPDRFGTRLEAALIGVFSLLLAALFLITMFISKKSEEQKHNARYVLTCGSIVELLYTSFYAYYLYIIFTNTSYVASGNMLVKFIFAELGLVWIFLSNLMPKIRRNGFIGLRTPDTLKSDEVWKKSQHFAGAAGIIIGLIMTAAAIVTNGSACVIVCITLIIVYSVVCTVYAHAAAVKENDMKNKK